MCIRCADASVHTQILYLLHKFTQNDRQKVLMFTVQFCCNDLFDCYSNTNCWLPKVLCSVFCTIINNDTHNYRNINISHLSCGTDQQKRWPLPQSTAGARRRGKLRGSEVEDPGPWVFSRTALSHPATGHQRITELFSTNACDRRSKD